MTGSPRLPGPDQVTVNNRRDIMRKPLLAIAVLTLSAMAAQAGPALRVAENDQPAAPPVVITTEPSEPAKPVEQKAAAPAKAVESTRTAAEPAKAAAEPTAAAEAKPVQPSKKARVARQESAEQKARRIAAKYGVYW
jgi:hypothetical protein